jgi:hypothetical protein
MAAMMRYGKFTDAVWIHQRMRASDDRFAQRQAAAEARRRLESLVDRLAAVYTVETDQAALIALVREAQQLVAAKGGGR